MDGLKGVFGGIQSPSTLNMGFGKMRAFKSFSITKCTRIDTRDLIYSIKLCWTDEKTLKFQSLRGLTLELSV
jgi:hypothetical protein